MIDVNTAKMYDISNKIKSQVKNLNEVSSELYLWAKQNSDCNEADVIIHQVSTIANITKSLKKTVLSIEKTASLCEKTSHKARDIIENTESFSGNKKTENIKLNDLTEISRLLSDYKFDME